MATHPKIYTDIQKAIRRAGSAGIGVSELIQQLPGVPTPGRVRVVLTALQVLGEVSFHGQHSLRGLPLRVRYIKDLAPVVDKSPRGIAEAVAKFHRRAARGTGAELQVILAVGRFGHATSSHLALYTGIPYDTVYGILVRGHKEHQTFRRSTSIVCDGSTRFHVYSLAPAGQRIFDAHNTQTMAAR